MTTIYNCIMNFLLIVTSYAFIDIKLFYQRKLIDIPNTQNLDGVQNDAIELGDENNCNHLIKGSSIHVDGGGNGQHKRSDSSVTLQFVLTTLESDRKRGGALTDHILC